LKLGIVGCGAIGSRIAASVSKELSPGYRVTALYDIDALKAVNLADRLGVRRVVKDSVDDLIDSCDVVVECVNTPAAGIIIRKALTAGKRILVMSVGRLLGDDGILALARRQRTHLLVPSGAVAGLDAIKAAAMGGITSVLLTTRKPPEGFRGNEYLIKRNVALDRISSEAVLFEGSVTDAVRFFPQNINVAAALALAAGRRKVRVRIIASPGLERNTHEIVCTSRSGVIRTSTENVPCPDNPKTSYLAVLSGIQVLRQLLDEVKIGT
jgi:aspartate dehydrogenase